MSADEPSAHEMFGRRGRHDELHVYVHLDKLNISLEPLQVTLTPARQHGQAVTAILTVGGSLMPARISIDDQNQEIMLFWVDDKGDTDAEKPDGAQVTFGSDNESVATADPQTGKLTPVAEGVGNGTVAITGPDGGPLMEPDGVTPFSADPAPFQVVAGQAVGAGLSIQSVPQS